MRPIMHRLRQFIRPGALVSACVWLSSTAFVQAQSQVSWNFVGPLGAPARIVTLAADPQNNSVVYAVVPGGGVWKTSDGGLNWNPITDSFASLQVCSIAIDPRSSSALYVGTGDDQSPRPLQGVAMSHDGGRTWTTGTRFTSQPICTLAVDPTDSARVFAGSAEGLFISGDSGVTWSKAVASPVSSIAFDPQGIVYVGIIGNDSGGARDHVLIRSSDNGNTWTNISLPANPFASTSSTTWVNVTSTAAALSVLVCYEPTPFLPGSSSSATSPLSIVDFYQSTDGGNTWSAPSRVGQARPPIQLLTDPSTGILYITGSTLLTSATQGAAWTTVITKTSDFHTAAISGSALFLAGEKGLEPISLIQGTAPPVLPQLFLGQFLGVSLDSHNGVWTAGPAGLFGPISQIATFKAKGISAAGNVFAAASSTDIFAAANDQIDGSTDGGQNFSAYSVLPSGEARAPFPPLIVDPVNNTSVFVAGSHVYHSTNSGQAWTTLPVVDPDATHVVIALAMAPAGRSTLYAATACLPEIELTSCPATSLIWRSANSGQTWTQTGSVSGYVNRLAVDPRQNNTIYAAIGAFPAGTSLSAGYVRGDLLQSTNMGSAWNSIRTNLPNVSVNAVVIDPTSLPPISVTINPPVPGGPFGFPGPIRTVVNQPAQTLYVATDAGVFVTFNLGGGGNTLPTPQWTDISHGLPPAPVTDISLRQPEGILVVATFGRGIYSLPTTGVSAGVISSSLSIETAVMQGATGSVAVPLTNISTTSSFGWRLNALDPWLSVSQPNGALAIHASAQVPVSISSSSLPTGTYIGRLQLVSGAFIQNIFVTAHITPPPAQMTIVGGNNGTGMVGATLPAVQVLVVDANGNPLSGIPVSFTVTTGGGSVSSPTAFTDNAGIASTLVTLPSNPGIVQLVAASGGLSATFTVTAVNAPSLMASAVLDGVTFNPYASPAPGSIISITGQNLSQIALAAGAGALPQVLGATSVLLVTTANTVSLPLLSVSPGQISAMLPTDVSPGSYSLRIENASVPSNDIQLLVAPYDPGILTQNGTGTGSGIFIKSDGSTVSASNPADRGSTITFFAAGLGAVNPPVAEGQPGALAEPFNRTVAVPRVVFDLYSAGLVYSGLPAGAPIPYQVTVIVPSQLSPATNISVSLTIGGFESNRVTIPVQ